MSLVSTLAKLAVTAMVAKGVGRMVQGGGAGSGGASGAGGLGGLGGLLGGALGGALGNSSSQSSGGGLGGALGSVLGGGGLGDLGALLGGKSAGNASPSGAGGLGGLLESIGGGGAPSKTQAPASGSLGDLLNSVLSGQQAAPQATPTQEEQAKILISAMIAGTKADGKVDQAEQQKIVDHLGDDISAEERSFVISEMQAPLDVDALVRSIPQGSQQQAYMMSLMGMTLDSQEEARFLDAFRKGLGISESVSNAIHEQLGVPVLYA
jgi:uncharacterized membrane protein YebE (DUF533 family)